jgi:hypothetical protein
MANRKKEKEHDDDIDGIADNVPNPIEDDECESVCSQTTADLNLGDDDDDVDILDVLNYKAFMEKENNDD